MIERRTVRRKEHEKSKRGTKKNGDTRDDRRGTVRIQGDMGREREERRKNDDTRDDRKRKSPHRRRAREEKERKELRKNGDTGDDK